MRRHQFLSPRFFSKGTSRPQKLSRIDCFGAGHGEGWLQELLYSDPELLPVGEIEPIFDGLIPLCREFRTRVGPLDMLFVNKHGLLTVVECKLWRNPEARRSVVGQILDYAQEIQRYDFSELDSRIRQARKDSLGLAELAADQVIDWDEAEFIDAVSRNLRLGRFLLLIVGDGIREGVENISDYLQQHATLNFGFGLVELGLYRLEESGYFVQPRLLARTLEIERAVVRIEGLDGGATRFGQTSDLQIAKQKPRRFTISEQVFFEQLSKVNPGATDNLKGLLERLDAIGISAEGGQNSLIIKVPESGMNFLKISTAGKIRNYRCGRTEEGRAYLAKLAVLLGGVVHQSGGPFQWTVKRRDGRFFEIGDLLAVSQGYVDLCSERLGRREE